MCSLKIASKDTGLRPHLPWALLPAVVFLAGPMPQVAAQGDGELITMYQLIELRGEGDGSARAYAINNTGQIIGYVQAGDLKHSAYWHNRDFTDLHGMVHFDLRHPLFDQDYSEAYCISDGGQIVGTARTLIECPPEFVITNAFVVRPAVLTDLATPYPGDALTNLMTLGDPCNLAYDSAAIGISNNNHVVGWADREDGVTHAFLVVPGGGSFYTDVDDNRVNDLMIDLGTLAASDPVSSATAVNDSGQVTGYSYTYSGGAAGYHAFLITPLDTDADGVGDTWFVDAGDGANALMIDLGTLGGTNSWGRAINNAGQIVGESDLDAPTGEHYTRAFIWSGGVMTDLGTLRDDPNHGFSAASGINNNGVVVGWAENEKRERRAFIWKDGRMQDLNDLLYLRNEDGSTTSTSIVLTEARDINDDGLIVGWGTVKGSKGSTTRGFLLTPIRVDPADLEEDEGSDSDDRPSTGSTGYSGVPIFGLPDDLVGGGNAGDGTDEPATPSGPSFHGLCGGGSLTMLPLTVLGWCALKIRRR